MERIFLRHAFFVLLQLALFFSLAGAQQADTAKPPVAGSTYSSVFQQKRNGLEGIFSAGFGTYSGFHDKGQFSTFIQPTLAFEFLANAGGDFRLLLGARIGVLKAFTTGVNLGLRFPLSNWDSERKLFADVSLLFFDDAEFERSLKYGTRLAFGGRTSGDIDLEYKLVAEYRGTDADSVDGLRKRTLWWFGAEVGVAFSFIGETRTISRKDSLRASLRYIATSDEMDELNELSSDAKIDHWLDRFWGSREFAGYASEGGYRTEYERRVDAANRMFSRTKVLGVLTDPGRVIAIYGTPDMERSEYSEVNNRNRYMVWNYIARMRGVPVATFLFRRTDGEPDWQEVYSNLAGETSGGIPADLPTLLRGSVGL
ncbi:MAG: GWxTD domain-containing protein [Ignavibacteriota bacterium]